MESEHHAAGDWRVDDVARHIGQLLVARPGQELSESRLDFEMCGDEERHRPEQNDRYARCSEG
jgi:hypothetical protein